MSSWCNHAYTAASIHSHGHIDPKGIPMSAPAGWRSSASSSCSLATSRRSAPDFIVVAKDRNNGQARQMGILLVPDNGSGSHGTLRVFIVRSIKLLLCTMITRTHILRSRLQWSLNGNNFCELLFCEEKKFRRIHARHKRKLCRRPTAKMNAVGFWNWTFIFHFCLPRRKQICFLLSQCRDRELLIMGMSCLFAKPARSGWSEFRFLIKLSSQVVQIWNGAFLTVRQTEGIYWRDEE